MFGLLLWGFKILRMIEENTYLKKYSSLQERAHKIGFSDNPILAYIYV